MVGLFYQIELRVLSSNFFDWAAPDEARREMKKPTFAKATVGAVGRTGQISNNFIRDLRAVTAFFEQVGEL